MLSTTRRVACSSVKHFRTFCQISEGTDLNQNLSPEMINILDEEPQFPDLNRTDLLRGIEISPRNQLERMTEQMVDDLWKFHQKGSTSRYEMILRGEYTGPQSFNFMQQEKKDMVDPLPIIEIDENPQISEILDMSTCGVKRKWWQMRYHKYRKRRRERRNKGRYRNTKRDRAYC